MFLCFVLFFLSLFPLLSFYFLILLLDHKFNLPPSVLSTTKDFNKFTTESIKASAPTKVIALSSALVIPPTIPEPAAITRTAVKPLANLPSYFGHTMPTPTQQPIAIDAGAQGVHKDKNAAGEEGLVLVLTPGGDGEDMSDLSYKGSAADPVTVSTLTVAPAIPSATAGVNLWFGDTENGKASSEFESALSSTSPESGDGKTTHGPANFPYSSEVDYQSDPADFLSLVRQCILDHFAAKFRPLLVRM